MVKYFKVILLLIGALTVAASFGQYLVRDSGDHNLYVHQANSFLQKRADITVVGPDIAEFQGRNFVPFPPFPAVVLLPFVWMFGVVATKTMIISILLTFLNAYIMIRILKKLQIDSRFIPWLVAAFLFGTGYWLCAISSSGVWFFAHVVAVTAMFLAINEALGKGRGWLVGIFLGMAFLSRQMMIFSIIFLAVAVWTNPRFKTARSRWLGVSGLALTSGLCVAVYLYFNWVRFGNPFDTGYTHIILHDIGKERMEKYGLFHPIYIPFNFIYMFLQGFYIGFQPTDFIKVADVDPFGTSLTFASPFVFFAFWAKWTKPLLWAAWTTIGLTLVAILFYFNNGSQQLNTQRFTLDFIPVLILLVALGVKHLPERFWKGAIIYAFTLNAIALFYIQWVAKWMADL